MAAYASQVIATAINEIGYREKASNIQLESKTANAGNGSYTKYANFLTPKSLISIMVLRMDMTGAICS